LKKLLIILLKEENKMKIAISSDGERLDNQIDQRFGRCQYFLIIDINKNKIENFKAIKNEGTLQGHGAGIKAAEQIGELKVDAVITGQVGPNATKVLDELKIKTYSASGNINDAILDFIKDKLEIITEAKKEENTQNITTDDKTEKIFFPLLKDEGLDSEISQHFGHAPFFGLYDVEKKELKVIPNNLNHTDPTKSPIDQIEDAVHPTTIFAKGIGSRAIELIKQKGLGLKTGNYNTIKEVIENLNNLEEQVCDCGHKH
jgi:predicted Fe-Mo cluster-binding NifX family protein